MASGTKRRTGFAYDEKLTRHYSLWNPDFTEVPDRIIKPNERCQQYKLIDRCHTIQSRSATQEEMEILHTKKHIATLKSSETMTEEELRQLSQKSDYIYFHNASFASASLALGTCIQLVDDILSQKILNGFAMVRPPGHHASAEEFNGYCYLNNTAVSAQYSLDKYKLKRILIIDWDVHHGQGIQRFFYNDPRVIYFSIHRYEFGREWPNLRESDYDYVGEGDGQGYNINVPLNESGCTNSDYLLIFFNILLPIAYEFDPELIIVSAGYDCALGCPEGEMEVTPVCFAHLINLLSPLAGGRLALLLEGGYCINSLSESIVMSIKTLLGDICPPLPEYLHPKESVIESVLNVLKVLRPFWSSLRYQPLLQAGETAKNINLSHLPSPSNSICQSCHDESKIYPLIQDCFTTTPDSKIKIEENEARLEQLIKNTTFRIAKHTLAVVCNETLDVYKSAENYSPKLQIVCQKLKTNELWDICHHIQGRQASKEEILLFGREKNVDGLQTTCTSFASFEISAVIGSVLNLVDCIVNDEAQSGIALISRPSSISDVLCIFNSITIATNYAKKHYSMKRILIVNWNNNQSCRIQDSYFNDNSILYISLRQGDDQHGTGKSDTSSEKSQKFNINIVWNKSNCTNGDYMAAFYQIILPIAYEFNPDLVLVSAGFSHIRSQEQSVTSGCFGHVIKLLQGLAHGKVMIMVEDEYDNDLVSECISSCFSVLLDQPCQSLGSLKPSDSGVQCICQVIDDIKQYWSSLQYREAIPDIDIRTIGKYCETEPDKV